MRDQIIIGLKDNDIRHEALKKSWNLGSLRKEGMNIESASRGGAEISGENGDVFKLGTYSYRNMRDRQKLKDQQHKSRKKSTGNTQCYNCDNNVNGSIIKHKSSCPARNIKCYNCHITGHFTKLCKNKDIKKVEQPDTESPQNTDETYNINLFRITTSNRTNQYNSGFKVEVIINNSLVKVIADTGAKVTVCSLRQAKQWGLYDKMYKSNAKLKPFNSELISVEEQALCSVSFNKNLVPVKWYIIAQDCEPILAGDKAVALGIITLNIKQGILMPINIIEKDLNNEIQTCLAEYTQNFQGIDKLKNHSVKLHVNTEVKPTATPPRSISYHLKKRASKVLEDMIKQDIIKEQPINEPAPWVSNAVIAPKLDGSIRMTLDACNVSKAILPTIHPIPRHGEIKAKLAECKIFSKMDLKSAFW